MSKFADIIGEARKPEYQKEITPGKQQSVTPEGQQLIETEHHKTGKLVVEKVKRESFVNITVKVAESKRNHWATEAKRKRKTLTEVITKALAKEFGEPTD